MASDQSYTFQKIISVNQAYVQSWGLKKYDYFLALGFGEYNNLGINFDTVTSQINVYQPI